MTPPIIRAVKDSEAFTVYLQNLDRPCGLPHDDSFPAFEGDGYDEETKFDEPEEWDVVELVLTAALMAM